MEMKGLSTKITLKEKEVMEMDKILSADWLPSRPNPTRHRIR